MRPLLAAIDAGEVAASGAQRAYFTGAADPLDEIAGECWRLPKNCWVSAPNSPPAGPVRALATPESAPQARSTPVPGLDAQRVAL